MATVATLKRSDSKATKEEAPPRTCLICTDSQDEDVRPFIRPCRICNSDFCEDCLIGMFVDAVEDKTRMPPKCCHLIQIHTVIGQLGDELIHDYRTHFEEWITPNKIYCPSPTCSAFIPERKVPSIPPTISKVENSLPLVLQDVVEALIKLPYSRFFRDDLPIDQMQGYAEVVRHPIHLGMIYDNITNGVYTSSNDLTNDMRLLVSNAKTYTGENSTITRSAEELLSVYLVAMSKITDQLIEASNDSEPSRVMFPCPDCHIAICTSCKKIEHSGSPCSTSETDHEAAMLAQFGYKRCPRCKAGVKKMYGCSHMQCLCGAHWCYYCQKPLNVCDGTCEQRGMEEEDEDEDYDSEEEEAVAEMIAARQRHQAANPIAGNATPAEIGAATAAADRVMLEAQAAFLNRRAEDRQAAANTANPAPTNPNENAGAVNTGPLLADAGSRDRQQPALRPVANAPVVPSVAPANPPVVNNRIVNLDAGGGNRWADGEHDFGEEPEEESVTQVWACHHNFETFRAPPEDGFNHGDLSRMECNRCFEKVVPRREPPKPAKKRRLVNGRRQPVSDAKLESQQSQQSQELSRENVPENDAHECRRCRIVVCVRCKERFTKEADDDYS